MRVDRIFDPKEHPATPYHYEDHILCLRRGHGAGQEAGWFYQSQGGNRAEGNLCDLATPAQRRLPQSVRLEGARRLERERASARPAALESGRAANDRFMSEETANLETTLAAPAEPQATGSAVVALPDGGIPLPALRSDARPGSARVCSLPPVDRSGASSRGGGGATCGGSPTKNACEVSKHALSVDNFPPGPFGRDGRLCGFRRRGSDCRTSSLSGIDSPSQRGLGRVRCSPKGRVPGRCNGV